MDDANTLERFAIAQRDIYKVVLSELRTGQKVGHWMWFIFPQLPGLGSSRDSETYAISSLEEAESYLLHPVLGERLVECCQVLTQLHGRTAPEIFGSTDAQKLRSSMTLFASAAPETPIFRDVLAKYFGGSRDPRSDEILRAQARRKGS